MIEFILGGARSGKSRFAEQLAIESEKKKIYIATAVAHDQEMRKRIEAHKERRSKDWVNIEEPYSLSEIIIKNDNEECCLLIDCLTLWASNLLHSDQSGHWQKEKEQLLNILPGIKSHIIFVSNEVGCGIIPLGEITRQYVDELGWFHQELAKQADKVTLVTAGIPHVIKET